MRELIKVENENQIKTVTELANSIWSQHYVPLIGQGQVNYMLDKFQNFRSIKEQIELGYSYYILDVNNTPSGYCAIKHNTNDKTTFISKLYVINRYRGEGLGLYLLKHIIEIAKNIKSNSLCLTVYRHNDNSVNWYKKRGFFIQKELKQDIGSGYVMDDYFLKKEI